MVGYIYYYEPPLCSHFREPTVLFRTNIVCVMETNVVAVTLWAPFCVFYYFIGLLFPFISYVSVFLNFSARLKKWVWVLCFRVIFFGGEEVYFLLLELFLHKLPA